MRTQAIFPLLILLLGTGCFHYKSAVHSILKENNSHRVIAILPPIINWTGTGNTRKLPLDSLYALQDRYSMRLQRNLYNYFQEEEAKNIYSVHFMDTDTITARFERAGYSLRGIRDLKPHEAMEILDVDAVLISVMGESRSEYDPGLALASSTLIGWPMESMQEHLPINAHIFGKELKDPLWKYATTIRVDLAQSSIKTANRMTSQFRKSFPYRVE